MFKHIQLIDGLHCYQDHHQDLPNLGDVFNVTYDAQSGEVIHESQPSYTFEGSHTTSIKINLSGRRVTVSRGNPSKINRLDNLFGHTTVDDCFFVYNQILLKLGLPPFTKCTDSWHTQSKDGKKALLVSNGAVVTEIHTTTNKAVGKGNVKIYLRGLASQRLRNSIPHLMPDGRTVQWLSKLGKASLVHSSVYDKAYEIDLHQLPKIKKLYGETSPEYQYLIKVRDYCLNNGVARFENKYKSTSLRRLKIQFWGLSDYSILDKQQLEFLEIDKKYSVNAMTMQSISDLLKEEGICNSTQAANATAGYYFLWLQGQSFDLQKRQVKTHRARLRKIKIDIAEVCDVTKHFAYKIKDVQEISVMDLAIPSWYQQPQTSHLSLVA